MHEGTWRNLLLIQTLAAPRRQLAKDGLNPMHTLDQMVGDRTWTFGSPYASSWLLFIASLMHGEGERERFSCIYLPQWLGELTGLSCQQSSKLIQNVQLLQAMFLECFWKGEVLILLDLTFSFHHVLPALRWRTCFMLLVCKELRRQTHVRAQSVPPHRFVLRSNRPRKALKEIETVRPFDS